MTKVDSAVINVYNISVGNPVLLGSSEVDYIIECANNATVEQDINCKVSSSHRNIQSVTAVTYPFNNINLIANYTKIVFLTNYTYFTNNTFLFNNATPYIYLNISAQWEFNNKNLTHSVVGSPNLSNMPPIRIPACKIIKMSIKDIIYNVSFDYNAASILSASSNDTKILGNELVSVANESISNEVAAIYTDNGIVFQSSGIIQSNIIQSIPQDAHYTECDVQNTTSPPTNTSTNPPSTANHRRLVVVTIPYVENPTPYKMSIFSMPQSQYDAIFNYDSRLSNLIIERCHRAWVLIPVFIPPFIFFFLPMWVKPTSGGDANIEKIQSEIPKHLERDIAKIASIGRFLSNTTEKQIVVNDLNGIKFYTQDYKLIRSIPDFCNLPFMITPKLNSGGCNSANLEGIEEYKCDGDYSCTGMRFVYIGVEYASYSKFYNNHNLNFGGIKIGDFDGDGIDDLWCHYPSSTLNYNKERANQIMFSPLRNRTTSADRCTSTTDLVIQGWCSNGVIKVGDFNQDKQSDVLCIGEVELPSGSIASDKCITSGSSGPLDRRGLILERTYTQDDGIHCVFYGFWLLYGVSGTFASASSETTDGRLTDLGNIIHGWTRDKKIFAGDFNGDRYSDLLMIDSNFSFLFGLENGSFIAGSNYTAFSSDPVKQENYITICKSLDVNRIFTSDINFDHIDEIFCVEENNNVAILFVRKDLDLTPPMSAAAKRQLLQVQNNDSIITVMLPPPQPKDRLNPLKKIKIIADNIFLDQNVNLQVLDKKNVVTQSSIKNMVFSNTKSNLESDTILKTVNDVYFPLENIKIEDSDAVVTLTFSGLYTALNNIGSIENTIQIPVSINAKWIVVEGNIVDTIIESNKANTFSMSSFVTPMSCFNSHLVNSYVTVRVNYEATAQMYIEKDDALVVGSDLKALSLDIFSEAVLSNDGDHALLAIVGYLDINILLDGYANMGHC